jgi:hypothetical protein
MCEAAVTLANRRLNMKTSLVPALAVLLGLVSLSACAGRHNEETPPVNAKPLSEIIKALEDQGYQGVERIKFDENAWEIKLHKSGGREVELHVDPMSGQIVKSE